MKRARPAAAPGATASLSSSAAASSVNAWMCAQLTCVYARAFSCARAAVGEEDFPRGAPLVADEPSRGGKNEKKRDTKPRAIALERFDEEEVS